MELLSKNFERWANDVNMEMPQLINRENASGSSIASFSRIHESIINTQYKPESEVFNFSEDEEKIVEEVKEEAEKPEEVVESLDKSALEEEFMNRFMEGEFAPNIEREVAAMPMSAFTNKPQEPSSISGAPEDFVVLENTQKEPGIIPEMAEVTPVVPGVEVAGVVEEPVIVAEEALPQAKEQETEVAQPVYPEEKIVVQESVVVDPVSTENVSMVEQIFDQEEAKKAEDIELYKQFMSNIM